MLQKLRQPVLVTLILLLLCGFVFPVVLTGLSAVLFPHQAAGSPVMAGDKVVGGTYIGQEFTQPWFLKGRPSAYHYNTYTLDDQGQPIYLDGTPFAGLSSGSNNFAPSNPALVQRVQADMDAILARNPGLNREDIPADLATASGSGLDPHISPASAAIQLPAISQASGLSLEELEAIVADHTTHKLLGVFGGEGVNVLQVNVDIARHMGLVEG